MSLTASLRAQLETVTTATLTTVLLKKGLRNTWIRGGLPLSQASKTKRAVGEAFTLRFIPAREDLATPASWGNPISTRAAIEAMPEGCFAVADAMGVDDSGIFGDILCARMAYKGVAGLVTDGVMRDLAGVELTGLPVWAKGTAAPSSITGLTFVGWNEPIACGGVAVFPGDVVVADTDGAVVIPKDLLEAVVEAAVAQEEMEGWILEQARNGAALPGLYPMNAEWKAKYDAYLAGKVTG